MWLHAPELAKAALRYLENVKGAISYEQLIDIIDLICKRTATLNSVSGSVMVQEVIRRLQWDCDRQRSGKPAIGISAELNALLRLPGSIREKIVDEVISSLVLDREVDQKMYGISLLITLLNLDVARGKNYTLLLGILISRHDELSEQERMIMYQHGAPQLPCRERQGA